MSTTPSISPATPRPVCAPRPGKVEAVVADCVYQIATGVWRPGEKLPPLRAAKERWGVNEVTCFRAYRRLVEDRMVESRDRDGYFVASGDPVTRASVNQERLRGLFEVFARAAGMEPGFTVLGAARAIAQMAEAAAAEKPECAFVECTAFQAEDHASEVRDRLRIPCSAITVAELTRTGCPPHVRALVTTPFHAKDLAHYRASRVAVAPIELAQDLIEVLRRAGGRPCITMALKPGLARSVAADLGRRLGAASPPFSPMGVAAEKVMPALERLLDSRPSRTGPLCILSPSLWSALDERWRGRPDVRPLQYRIVPAAWRDIAGVLGLPPPSSLDPASGWTVSNHA